MTASYQTGTGPMPRPALPLSPGIDAWPLCLTVRDPEEMAHCVAAVAAGFGGVCLEDIAAPRCFAVERHLQRALDVPVVHDDQHGTAVVVLAGLENAFRLTGKTAESARIVISGAGAAGTAVVRLLQASGVSKIAIYDSKGPLHPGRDDIGGNKKWLAGNTQPDPSAAGAGAALDGADVFIGLFRGLLDSRTRELTITAQRAAAHAIASTVGHDDLDTDHIMPSVFDEKLVPAVAAAVRDA